MIQVTSVIGTGNTELGAFDNALHRAGVSNYNLLRLSSVIPYGEQVKVVEVAEPNGKWGDKLYVVMAIQIESEKGKTASAGIGWARDKVNPKMGLFVEHEHESLDKVKELITDSLGDLFETRGLEKGEIEMETVSGVVEDKPICAFVVAVFEDEDWRTLGENL